jgi:stearoyl-CoA desaturase (delta-9 desaturase)
MNQQPEPQDASALGFNTVSGGPVQNPLAYRAAVLVVVVVPFLATLYAIQLLWNHWVDWGDLALLASMYVLVAFGVTVGFHRMLTHRSFEAHPVVRAVLLILGSMSLEGAALDWAAVHLKHHALSDKDGDPHSPIRGFFHAHIGWMITGNLPEPATWCRAQSQDPVIVFVSRTFFVWVVLSLLIPFLIGGWSGLLWGGLVRVFLTHHVTWSVNSVCHTFGFRTFKTTDRSSNQWVVGLLAMGEGWHNNHHAFPRSAFHGLTWWQVDASAYLIRLLERLRLVWNVQRVSLDMQSRKRADAELAAA